MQAPITTKALEIEPHELVFRRFRLQVIRGPDEGAEAISSGEETTIGTEPGNDLVLGDRTVSRHHAAVRATASGLRLSDLGSTNGTVLGGYRVFEALLKPEALIGAGRTVIRLDLTDDEVRESLSERLSFGAAIGHSPAMRRVFSILERFAPAEGTVLLEGETGTGKELLARAIHDESPRESGPFVVVDCGAIAPALIESELFGHARGAFTGAVEPRPGAFETARGGTIFLDEIGELPPALQPALLRALEDRSFKRVGEDRPRKIDVRVIAATNRDLRHQVNRGRFRADLYYRLAVLRVKVPPLRERPEDIPPLLRHFHRQLGGSEGGGLPGDLVTALSAQPWPGNARELRSAVQRALLLDEPSRWGELLEAEAEAEDRFALDVTYGEAKERAVTAWEAEYVRQLLGRFDGNLARAARSVGMSRNHLRKLAERYRLRE